MQPSIAQFNIQFDALEDRLLLRVLTTADEEIRLWLTRRYVRLLLQVLEEQLGAMDDQDGDASVSQGEADDRSFGDQYMANEGTHLPLGKQPTLVSRLMIKDKNAEHIGLFLGQEEDAGVHVELGLDLGMVDALRAMLLEAAKLAEWDLSVPTKAEAFTEHLSGVVLH